MTFPLALWISSEDRESKLPITAYTSASIDVAKHDTKSTATIEVPLGAASPWLEAAAIGFDSGSELGAEISLDAYWRDFTTPIFSGPMSPLSLRETRDGRTLSMTFEHWAGHAMSRRVNLTATGDKFNVGSGKADRVTTVLMITNGFGASPTTPAGYPATRTDFDSWAFTTTLVAGSHATTINPDVSDGRRILEEVESLLELYDMALEWTETSAGVFTLEIDHQYQSNDLTDTIALDLRRGTLSSYEETIDPSSLENVVMMKVSGGNNVFIQDATSVTDRGVYEGAYAPPQYDSTASTDNATAIKSYHATPFLTVAAEAVEMEGARFNVDYARRDLITVRSGIAGGRTADLLCIGAKITSDGRRAKCSPVFGDIPLSYDADLRKGDGTRMGRGRGMGSNLKLATP